MKNKLVDKKLDNAVNLVEKHLCPNNKLIEKEYEGAISSFGPLVVQNGPLPACALYLKTGGGSSIEKARLVAILFALIENNDDAGVAGVNKKLKEDVNRNLLDKAITHHQDKGEVLFQHELLTATMTLKLTMRVFSFK